MSIDDWGLIEILLEGVREAIWRDVPVFGLRSILLMEPKLHISRASKPVKQDPYCAFKSDKLRLCALIARNVRDVLVVMSCAAAGWHVPWSLMLRWITSAA